MRRSLSESTESWFETFSVCYIWKKKPHCFPVYRMLTMQSFLLVASWFCHNETLPTLFFLAHRQPIGSSVCGYFNAPEKDTINFGLWQSSCANTHGLLDIFRIWGEIWVTNELLLCPRWGLKPHSTMSMMSSSADEHIPARWHCVGYSVLRLQCCSSLRSSLVGEQADSADGTDCAAWLGMLMPHLIYGCVKCRVRSFHRQNELPPGNKKKKVMVIVCPLVMTVESTPPPEQRENK